MTREEIINELKKWAIENGGKTPGEKVFYETTEVGITDRRKFWANYGELVSEAGLTPNQFDKTKYSREQLCKLFIGVMRDKHKWPTRGILEVTHHNNPSFPNHVTFYKNLGLTRKLAGAILEFISDNDEYNDVAEICKSELEKYKYKSSDENNSSYGFVYLGKQHGRYKIGKTTDLNRRREDISLMGPEPMVYIHEIKTDDMNGLEAYWHKRFESKRQRGEWFKLNSSDVKAFKRWIRIF